MAPVATPLPQSTPFSPLAGWGGIVIVLVLLAAVAVVFLAFVAVQATAHERSDWQGWLDARSARRRDVSGMVHHRGCWHDGATDHGTDAGCLTTTCPGCGRQPSTGCSGSP